MQLRLHGDVKNACDSEAEAIEPYRGNRKLTVSTPPGSAAMRKTI